MEVAFLDKKHVKFFLIFFVDDLYGQNEFWPVHCDNVPGIGNNFYFYDFAGLLGDETEE